MDTINAATQLAPRIKSASPPKRRRNCKQHRECPGGGKTGSSIAADSIKRCKNHLDGGRIRRGHVVRNRADDSVWEPDFRPDQVVCDAVVIPLADRLSQASERGDGEHCKNNCGGN